MSAKLTHVSSGGEEKAAEVLLDRHIGCMTGMFQLLGRRRLLAKRRRLTNGDRSHNTLPPPPPPGTCSSSSGRALSSKIKQREEYKPSSPRIISEHAPRKSSSEIQRASTEQRRAPLPSSPSSSSSSLDIRGIVKDSINGEARCLSVKTSPRGEVRSDNVSKHQDSPRPTMSEQVLTRLKEAARNSLEVPRFSCDGREISRTKSTKLREVPRLSLDSRESSVRSSDRRSPSVIAKLMGLEPIPSSESREPTAPMQNSTRADDGYFRTPNAVRSRVEGRAKEVEFGESDGDKELRALKHILGTMLESKNSSSDAQTPHVATASPRALEAPNVITKPVKSVSRLETASRTQQANAVASKTQIPPMQDLPRRQPAEGGRSAGPVQALSPRVQQRKIELEKKPRPPPTRTQPADRKQHAEPTSPRGNNRLKPNRAKKNSRSRNEEDADAKRDDCSRKMEPLLFRQGKQKKSLRIVKEEVSMAERTAFPPEQPSPISVLDSSFYQDDSSSPSPVKRISGTLLEGDDMQTSIEDCNDSWKLHNIESLVQKLRQLSSTGESDDESQEPIPNCVFEIITEHSSPAKANPEKLHRRLMLDVVQEVLAQRMELISHGPQSELFARARKLGGQFLLRELCREIKWLLAERPRDGSFANKEEAVMSGENLLRRWEGWEDFGLEVPEVVLEIERLIFKDLIDNVVTGEADSSLLGRAAQRRRQLFA